MDKTVCAESVNYWKTSTSQSETWIEKAKREIASIGGQIQSEAIASQEGRTAFMLDFRIGAEQFRLIWAVLPCKSDTEANRKAAKVQAATLLYHDVKHKVVMAKIKGVRTAFLEYLLLPNGQNAAQVADDPALFLRLVPPLLLDSGKE